MRGQTSTQVTVEHPRLGRLTLNRERLSINGAEGLKLVIYHPEPGSADAEKLASVLRLEDARYGARTTPT